MRSLAAVPLRLAQAIVRHGRDEFALELLNQSTVTEWGIKVLRERGLIRHSGRHDRLVTYYNADLSALRRAVGGES